MIDIRNVLSFEIWGKEESLLDETQIEFLNLHVSLYSGYQQGFVKLWKSETHKRVIDGRDYEYILHCYCRRVHLDSVRTGIVAGKKLARELGKIIIGFRWFIPHIEKMHIRRIANVNYNIGHNIWIDVDKPFFYAIFKTVIEKKLPLLEYDPWTGFKEKIMIDSIAQEPDCDKTIRWSILKSQENLLLISMRQLEQKRINKGLSALEIETLATWQAQLNDLQNEIVCIEADNGG